MSKKKEENVIRTIRPTKNWNVPYSWLDTNLDPYQNTSAMTKKTMDWDNEYKRLLQIAVLFDFRRGSSKLLLYKLQQSSSRVRAATVRMEAAASQAS